MSKRSNGEGSISKRNDGRWCAAHTVGGKRKYLYGKTRKEVARKPREASAKTASATYYPDIGLEDYMGRWLEDSVRGSARVRHYERYESVSRVQIVPELGV